jgi:hypothetical protein
LSLEGKDYLSEAEAAHYCCVSISQFRSKAISCGIVAGWFMGKKVYRRVDLIKAIEAQWQPYVLEVLPGFSSGMKPASSTAKRSAKRK